jgi:hypothetical protein
LGTVASRPGIKRGSYFDFNSFERMFWT